MFSPEINKINADISKEQNINVLEVEKVIKLYHKAIADKIATDEPCSIIMPFLGKLFPNKKYQKTTDETNNN